MPSTQRPLGRYMPRGKSYFTNWRFRRDRYAELLRRIGTDRPTERQALIIEELVKCEWREITAERDAAAAEQPSVRALAHRNAANANRQILLWSRELDKTIPPAPEPAAASQPSLNDVLADITRRRSALDPEPEDGDEAAAA